MTLDDAHLKTIKIYNLKRGFEEIEVPIQIYQEIVNMDLECKDGIPICEYVHLTDIRKKPYILEGKLTVFEQKGGEKTFRFSYEF